MISDAQYDDLFRDAADPAADPTRLHRIVAAGADMSYGEKQTIEPALFQRGVVLIESVARNPNITLDTMTWLASIAPLAVLDNPTLPLVIVSGDWSGWSAKSFFWMRAAAFKTGHPLYPVLMTVCRAEWRTHRRREGWFCLNSHCALCRSEERDQRLATWRRNAMG
jgi:hypothetical protein